MKLQILSLAALVASSQAFAPSAFGARPATLLRADASAAIEDAKAAAEKYGKDSKEARAAWDIVEEIDAASSHSSAPAPVAAPEEVEEASAGTAEADEWAQKRKDALAEAQKLTAEEGASSPAARIAWELVEELAATASHHEKTGSG